MVKKTIAVLTGLFFAIIILEVFLRLYPIQAYKGNVYLSKNCIANCVSEVNKLGFRDQEWVENNKFSILILGDSYMVAEQIPEGIFLAPLLENLTGLNVMNASKSGFGVLHEYLLYKDLSKNYHPDLVLLFFYSGNDIRDSYIKLAKIEDPKNYRVLPLAYIDKQGNINIKAPATTKQSVFERVASNLSHNLKVFNLLMSIYTNIRLEEKYTKTPVDFFAYTDPDQEWEKAWKITEFYLKKLSSEVYDNGGELLLVFIAGPAETFPDSFIMDELRKYFKDSQIPKDLNISYPQERLRRFAKAERIKFLDMVPYFKKYRDKYKLEYPYFVFRCDGHWNPLSHFLGTNILVEFLINEELLPISNPNQLKKRAQKNLNLSPVEILGDQAYDQIYTKGSFSKDTTNILRIISSN